MSRPPRRYTANTLLQALSDDDLDLLKPDLTRVELTRGKVLVEPETRVAQVYFPEGGVVSIVSIMARSGHVETGLFGREGVSATCLLLGTDRSPHQTFVQIDGATALAIEADRYLAAVRGSETLRTMLLRYVQTVMVQSTQTMASAGNRRLEPRLARWLLMCHDRIDGDEIALTHEYMGLMISAERSGVTLTLHILEGAGMIWSKRGRVIIRDRALLAELAGDSYGLAEAEYRRLIGPLGHDSSVTSIGGQRALIV